MQSSATIAPSSTPSTPLRSKSASPHPHAHDANFTGSDPLDLTDEDHDFVFERFKGYTLSERRSSTRQWVWKFGFDISKAGNSATWVCGFCVKKRDLRPSHYDARNLSNVELHLSSFHNVRNASAKRTVPNTLKRPHDMADQMSVVSFFGLDVNDANQQAMANRLVASFNKEEFQRKMVKWMVSANLPFRTAQHPFLREVLEYLSPSVGIQRAHISDKSVRAIAFREYEKNKGLVAKTLQESPGQVHLAFDGWTSTNGLSLYGVSAVYRDRQAQPHKIVLGLPEMDGRHTGKNIAAAVLEVISSYDIEKKIGYFTVDNASNNDTALAEIGDALGFHWPERRVRCLGHVINLVVKALLFGQDYESFERDVNDGLLTVQREHEQWRKRGPIGKLHNFCQEVNRSDLWTRKLISAQEHRIREAAEDSGFKAHKPVKVVTDNATRWLSQFYMMQRALRLKPFYDTFIFEARAHFDSENRTRCGNLRKGVREPYFLQEGNRLEESDWEAIQALHDILLNFELVIKSLQGDSQSREKQRSLGEEAIDQIHGASWEILDAYEFLLDGLETAKGIVAGLPEGDHLVVNVNNAWKKLDSYYAKAGESPLIYAAAVLNPGKRWDAFDGWYEDHPNWIDAARQQVYRLWREQYKDLPIDAEDVLEPPRKALRLSTNKFTNFKKQRRDVSGQTSASLSPCASPAATEPDEFELWEHDHAAGDKHVEDPRLYWHKRRQKYPRLSRMALDLHTVLPMSAEVERLFSVTGHMVVPLRNRLHADTLSLCQTIRSWYHAGVIQDLDPMLKWTGNMIPDVEESED
ncbi:hypothetical protein FPOA_28533 [Fusarium poae]|jgi:hypothetical protein|uniref:HAT C-terminal dimerisation domain-containing protein n=1 Tax=Fusarium poae TaxID=36050 RepID=A0A1B8A4E9_FUSPO|nr:hypothetical protein FPOA_28533 [Fusarium poae]